MGICGNPKCGSSTGIHEGLTFGSGRLDEHGYWEFPCSICAREWDERRPKVLEEMRQEVKQYNPQLNEEELDNYIHVQHEWLFIEGWPFPDQDIAALSAEVKKHLEEGDAFEREMRNMFPELYEEE